MIDSRHLTVYLQLVLAMLFFGLSFVFSALALQTLPPITLIVLRLLVSTAILLLFSRISMVVRVVGAIQRPDRNHRLTFLIIAFFQPFLYFLAENTGLLYASPAAAAIVVGTIPVATPVFAHFVIRERIGKATVIGAILSFFGVLILVLSDAESGRSQPIGVLLVSGAVIAAVGYSIALRKLPEKYSAMTVVTWQNVIGLILFAPFLVFFDLPGLTAIGSRLFAGPSYEPLLELLGAVVFLGIFPSTVSFVFLSRGIRVLGATRANVTTNLVPVFAALFSIVVLGERVQIGTVAGMAVVICGVLLSQFSRLRARTLARRNFLFYNR